MAKASIRKGHQIRLPTLVIFKIVIPRQPTQWNPLTKCGIFVIPRMSKLDRRNEIKDGKWTEEQIQNLIESIGYWDAAACTQGWKVGKLWRRNPNSVFDVGEFHNRMFGYIMGKWEVGRSWPVDSIPVSFDVRMSAIIAQGWGSLAQCFPRLAVYYPNSCSLVICDESQNQRTTVGASLSVSQV